MNNKTISEIRPRLKGEKLKKSSDTILLHTQPIIHQRGKQKKFDIVFLKPSPEINYDDCETIIGIEIKFNRRYPAGKEKSGILNDIKKAKDNKKGYILWLNWDRPISNEHKSITNKVSKKCGNVKFWWIDTSSGSVKTNLKAIIG